MNRLGRYFGALSRCLPDKDPTPPPVWGWLMARGKKGFLHVYPGMDYKAHLLDDACPCKPELDGEGVMAHNSFDGRERYELYGARRH